MQLMYQPSPIDEPPRVTVSTNFEITLDLVLEHVHKLKQLPGLLRFWVESEISSTPWQHQTASEVIVKLTALYDVEGRYEEFLRETVEEMQGFMEYECATQGSQENLLVSRREATEVDD